MSISAIITELAKPGLHEVSAQLCPVIQFEVLNVSQHLLTGLEVHLLLFSCLLAGRLVVEPGVLVERYG